MRRALLILTIPLAIAFGVLLALRYESQIRPTRMVQALLSEDPARRDEAWAWLLTPDEHGVVRASTYLGDINISLAGAPDEILLDGRNRLGSVGLWSWSHQSYTLILRELGLRALHGSARSVADDLFDCPLNVSHKDLIGVVHAVLASEDPAAHRSALDAYAAWLGPDQLAWTHVNWPAFGPEIHRRATLMHAEQPVELDPELPLDILEALALHAEASTIIEAIDTLPSEARPALAYALRDDRDVRSAQALEQLDDDGVRTAGLVLQMRREGEDDAQSRRVVRDEGRPIPIRRLAAWRWTETTADDVDAILAGEVIEPDGTVYAAALFAERFLDRDDARALAETWLTEFDEDRKRAGAVLAALVGGPTATLDAAYESEDVAAVRTIMRLAQSALGDWNGPGSPAEFADRMPRALDGEVFHPDAAVCLLAGGHAEALAWLTSQPPVLSRETVQQRAWLIERFVPSWHEALGRPIGGDPRVVRLHFDALDALRVVTSRRLVFDPDQRCFRMRTAEGEADGG